MKLTAFNSSGVNVKCIALELRASERISAVTSWEQMLSTRIFFGKLCSVALRINKDTESFIVKNRIKDNKNYF